jgi:Zn-dependent protease with chaperone function
VSPRLKQQPLWVRVDENRVKLAVFVVLFIAGSALLLTAALVGVPGSLFGLFYTSDVPVEAGWYWSSFRTAFAVGFGVLLALGSLAAAIQLSNAEDWVRNRFKGTAALPGAYPALERVVSDMAIAGGLPEHPGLVVLDTPAVNAYALGTARSRAVIGVTRGFLEGVPPEEQRAVVATLVARIASGDILFATALAALMGPLKLIRGSGRAALSGAGGCAEAGCGNGCSGLGDAGDGCTGCLLDDLDSDPGGCLGAITTFLIIVVIAAITYAAVVTAAWIVTFWGRLLHRTSYEKADAEGMLLLRDPAPMLAALARAIVADTTISDGDPSYDGIFYTQTSGTPAIEKIERRRLLRLAEVLGADGAVAVANGER